MLKSNDYEKWADMLSFEKSTKPAKAIYGAKQTGTVYAQKMKDAFGDLLNTDYYAVKITKLPENISAADLYTHIRQNFGNFMDPSISELQFPTKDNESEKKWLSNNPSGAILSFVNPMDTAPVLTTLAEGTHWVFTPITTFWDFQHPLAGHREFGLTKEGDTGYTFYTRGVDRMWSPMDVMYNLTKGKVSTFGGIPTSYEGNAFFSQADQLWNHVMDEIVNYINNNGGEATKTHNFNRRINWNDDVQEKDK